MVFYFRMGIRKGERVFRQKNAWAALCGRQSHFVPLPKKKPRNPHKHLVSEDFSFPLEIQIMSAKSPFFPHFPQLSEKKRCQLGVRIT